MPALTQEDRMLQVTTPLGTDGFILLGFQGREALSEPFQFSLEFVTSQDGPLDPNDWIAKPIAWHVLYPDETPRYFHGLIRSIIIGEELSRGLQLFQLEVVPWFGLLSHSQNSRIFQNQSSSEIFETVCNTDFGFSDFEFSCNSPANRPYCVQYQESAQQFLSRLFEEDGLYYYFDYTDTMHKMVIDNQSSAAPKCLAHDTAEYRPDLADAEVIRSWARTGQHRPGRFTHTDYFYTDPPTDQKTQIDTVTQWNAPAKYEIFEYPGRYINEGNGSDIAKIRIEEVEATTVVIHGSGQCSSFQPGYQFQLKDHPIDDGESFLLTAVSHSATERWIPGVQTGEASYSNHFECIPVAVPYRPKRRTVKPRVIGPQSAVVVGKSGEEIWTDQYGCVLVQFTWDRLGNKDENTTCFLRVAQSWAGDQYGTFFLPRIGQEVIVEFLNGDPDQPVITGSMYNADQMPPFALPGSQTQSGIRTRSTPGGTAQTSNELRFEDKKDHEDIYFRAQKDFHREVLNDDDLLVKHDQTQTITNDRTIVIEEGNDEFTVKKGNRTITIGEGNHELTVTKGNRVVVVSQANDELTVSQGNHTIKVDSGDDTTTISQGNHSIKVNLGTSTIEAMQGISLKVGSNTIEITQSGIKISGMNIEIAGQVQTKVSGAISEVSGSGMLTVKGGIVKIN